MSLCASHIDDYNNVSPEIFDQYLVDFPSFSDKSTETLQHSDLVVRICGK